MRGLFTLPNKVFDLLLWPFQSVDPIYPLATVSLLVGLLMVIVFRYASNQKEIKRVKARIQAHFLEVGLFQDQLGLVLRAHARILRCTLTYMGYSLKPLAVMFLPLVLVLVQLEMRLGRIPPRPHDSFVLTAKLAADASLNQVSLRLPAGLKLSAPPLRILEEKEVDWRLQAERYGEYEAEVAVAGETFVKQITVSDQMARLSTRRAHADLLQEFLYPGEPSLPKHAPVEAIEVKYRRRTIDLWIFQAHWMVPFFLFSLVSGIALKRLLRTEI